MYMFALHIYMFFLENYKSRTAPCHFACENNCTKICFVAKPTLLLPPISNSKGLFGRVLSK